VTDSEPTILAIDLGTSETKVGLLAHDGRLLAVARAPHPLALDAASGCAEQDPEDWWSALRAAMARLRPVISGPVAAICCVGQGPTLVVSDATGRATRPAITWMDRRPADQAMALEAATGMSGWGLGILPAARWVEVNDPVASSHARWYLNAWEWAALRLTGRAATTRVPGQRLPDPERAASAGLTSGRLPEVVETGTTMGGLTAAVAAELALDAGTPVIAGTVDSFASFHGAGLVDPGDAVDTGGTSGGLAVYWDSRPAVPEAWVAAAPLPGRWLVGGAMSATGRSLDWLADNVVGGRGGAAALVRAAARVPPGAQGLVFLPYLAGERSPLWDPAARGAFVGLTLSHDRAHLARAVLEAGALALRHVAAPIRAAGIRIDELRITGGTARGDTWNQIKADVLGIPVAIPAVRETALAGAAILGARGLGLYDGLREAIEAMVRIDHRLQPDDRHRATYDALFDVYVGLWPAIRPYAHLLGDLPPAT
jgi:xylulokinase